MAMVFFGDGATSQGDFRALNFAGVYGVPAVFVCQNNRKTSSFRTRPPRRRWPRLAHGVNRDQGGWQRCTRDVRRSPRSRRPGTGGKALPLIGERDLPDVGAYNGG